MPDDPRVLAPFDPSLVERLACPACLGNLCLEEARMVCVACGCAYPIVKGIPVLIQARGEGDSASK